MQTDWLIIDGYSLMHRAPSRQGPDLMSSRHRLIRRLEALAGRLSDRITVVFDGRSPNPGADFHSSIIEVVFSPGDKTADTIIERMVHQSPAAAGILVVTSDRMERDTVMAAGAQTMSCGDFLDWSRQCEERSAPRNPLAALPQQRGGATLGDFFPEKK